jgi:hypothetical protein
MNVLAVSKQNKIPTLQILSGGLVLLGMILKDVEESGSGLCPGTISAFT